MLETATVNWEKALKINNARKEAFQKARNGELSQEEEIKLLFDIINTKVADGHVIFDVPFRISDKANEVIISMLYRTFRKDDSTTISC